MKIRAIHPSDKYSDRQIHESIMGILGQSNMCSYATITETPSGPMSHICTAFYCLTDDFTFYILTAPSTQHGKNLEKNTSVAMAICDSHQVWDNPKQGLQLFGTMQQAPIVKVPEAFTTYVKEYPGLLRYLTSPSEIVDKLESRFYLVKILRVKIFDEPTFGSEVWIDVELEQ